MIKTVIFYIATSEEKQKLTELNSDAELNNFLIKFWKDRDPSPRTEINEYKDEHIKRFKFTNKYLGGWQTDQGRVYILYGPPFEIISEPTRNSGIDLEIWIYDEFVTEPERSNRFNVVDPLRRKFVFGDRMGFGIKEQIYTNTFQEN